MEFVLREEEEVGRKGEREIRETRDGRKGVRTCSGFLGVTELKKGRRKGRRKRRIESESMKEGKRK